MQKLPGDIARLEVPIVVRLAERTVHVREVLALVPGTIIELNKPTEHDLDLLVNNRVLGQGRAVKVGENFGIKITHLGDASTRQTKPAAPSSAAAAEPHAPELSPEELAEVMLSSEL